MLTLWSIRTPKLHLYDDMRDMLRTHFTAMQPETTDDYRAKIMATLLLETVRHFFERGEPVSVAAVRDEMEAAIRLLRDTAA